MTHRVARRPRAGRRLLCLVSALALAGCFDEFPDPLARGADAGETPDMPIDPPPDVEPGDGEPTFDMALDPDGTLPDDQGFEPDGVPPIDADLPDGDLPDDLGFDQGPDPDMMLEPDMAPEPDMMPDMAPIPDLGPPEPEVCNGLDDDRDGIADEERVCGRIIESRCRLFWGWSDNDQAPDDGSPTWASCPERDEENFGGDDRACRGTRRDGNFRLLGMPFLAGVDSNDSIGLALLCDGEPDAVTAWIQRSCTVMMGHTDNGIAGARDVWDDWGGCIARAGTNEPLDDGWRCLSTNGDGLFHRLDLVGNVNGDDHFGVAFRCRDPNDPLRAASVQASAAVVFGWSDWDLNGGIGDGGASWGGCPGADRAGRDNEGVVRCASSAFDGRFHHFNTGSDVGDLHAFGIALMSHPDAP